MDFKIQRILQQIWCKIKQIEVTKGIQSIIPGTNVTVDNTDPLNPIISASGGGGIDDQDNIPRLIVDIPFSDLNIPEDSTEEEIDQAFATYIEDLQPDVDDTTIPFYRLRDVPGGGSGGDLTLEQARQNGNVLEGDVELSDFKKIFSNGSNNGFLYFDDGTPIIGFTSEEKNYNLTFDTNQLGVITDNTQFKGIVGNQEFNKQGDRKAFAQLSDVYDNSGIPLTGTEEGKPVTGAIEIVREEGSIFSEEDTYKNIVDFQNPQIVIYSIDKINNYVGSLTTSFDNVIIYSNSPYSRGLIGGADYTSNIRELDYTQKKYVDNSNSYSTEETLTGGTWIDGSPIYRRVITGVANTGDFYILPLDFEKRVIKLEGFFSPTTSDDFRYPFNKSLDSFINDGIINVFTLYSKDIHTSDGLQIDIYKQSDFEDRDFIYTVIVEYTKNTD